MVNFTFKFFLLLVSIFTPIFAMAENEDNNEVGDLKYEITGENTVSVRGFANNKFVSDLVIPEQVTLGGQKYTITGIADDAFNADNTEYSAIKKLTLPKTVKEIGNRAFYCVGSLVEINFNEGLEYIGQEAFSLCNNLKEVSLPNSLQKIDYGAFIGDKNLEKITPSNNLKWIDAYTFQATKWLDKQPEGLVYFGNALLTYKGTVESFAYVKEGITLIAEEALRDCKSITKCILPKGIKIIAGRAFKYCNSLTYIYVPEGIEYIGDDAFVIYPDNGIKTTVSLPNTFSTYILNCRAEINYVIRYSDNQNMYIATALKPVFNAVDNIYVPGGCSKFYTEKGFTNVKELYSYDIDSKDNYIYVKVNPNYDFVKINKVSFWDRDMFYYMDMTYDENEKAWKYTINSSRGTRAIAINEIKTKITCTIGDLTANIVYTGEDNKYISTSIDPVYKAKYTNNTKHYNIQGIEISPNTNGLHIVKDKFGKARKVIIR